MNETQSEVKAHGVVHVRLGSGTRYDIRVGAGLLAELGRTVQGALPRQARRLAVVSNRRVFDLYGTRASESLRGAGYAVTHWLMGDGESYKSLRTAAGALRFFSQAGIERSDAVVALGGGVVGDLAGFASAIYLRGIALVQVPTTLLSQIDSSVGGKTGVNLPEGKNLVGAFHHPRAVLIDTSTLRSLPPRELTAGWCEAVKQGVAGDRRLFDKTLAFLSGTPKGRLKEAGEDGRERELMELIAAQCAFKAKIVAGDEREAITRTDARSRRILNFGHTTGHALESVTRYRRFRHGEAVGYGMLVAAEISVRIGLLARSELESLREAVRLAGRLPRADDLDETLVLNALRTDKKSVGGSIQWVLLEELGRARIVDGGEVPQRVVRASLRAALKERWPGKS